MKELISWKNKPGRKPLIIRGARQVGKTWLIKEFGKNEYSQTAYVNFESLKLLKPLFIDNFDINRIITALRIETGIQINPENTLIILDEIQEAEGAITSLKYFCEDATQYHIIAAGSLLGVAMHKHISFPVGKVEFLDLYPLNYAEFLMARDQQPLLNFLIQYSGEAIPIEVKAEEDLQAKRLKTFCQKYLPKTAVRTSMSDFRKEDWLTNIPLYAIGELSELSKLPKYDELQ